MKLDAYIRKTKIKAGDMAAELGISEGSLSRIRHGTQEPSLRVAINIEDATKGKVRPRDLLTEER